MSKFMLPLVASATTAAGGSLVLTGDSLVQVSSFWAGIVISAGAAYWLGQKISEVKDIKKDIQEQKDLFKEMKELCYVLQERLFFIEKNCISCKVNTTDPTRSRR